jgi:hypothetical protein
LDGIPRGHLLFLDISVGWLSSDFGIPGFCEV